MSEGSENKVSIRLIPDAVFKIESCAVNHATLYAKILELSNNLDFCWASNEYLEKALSIGNTKLKKLLKDLVDGNHVKKLTFKARGKSYRMLIASSKLGTFLQKCNCEDLASVPVMELYELAFQYRKNASKLPTEFRRSPERLPNEKGENLEGRFLEGRFLEGRLSDHNTIYEGIDTIYEVKDTNYQYARTREGFEEDFSEDSLIEEEVVQGSSLNDAQKRKKVPPKKEKGAPAFVSLEKLNEAAPEKQKLKPAELENANSMVGRKYRKLDNERKQEILQYLNELRPIADKAKGRITLPNLNQIIKFEKDYELTIEELTTKLNRVINYEQRRNESRNGDRVVNGKTISRRGSGPVGTTEDFDNDKYGFDF